MICKSASNAVCCQGYVPRACQVECRQGVLPAPPLLKPTFRPLYLEIHFQEKIIMSGAPPALSNKTKTFVFLTLCGLFAIGAAALGIDDNPPGILLAYLAAFAFILAFAHSWQTARPFVLLLLVSAVGLVLFVVLNNLFAAVAHDPATVGAFQKLMQGLAVSAFFLGTLIFPAGFVVGVAGSIVMFIRNRRRTT